MLLLQDIFPDKASERRILSYSVRCPCGCPWTGELRDVEVRSYRAPSDYFWDCM